MPKFTDDDLIDMFGDRTYERGLDYYHGGNVSDPLKLGGVLYAEVWGNADAPYRTSVTIEGAEVFSDCSCPVGDMCKHGVAVLLTWMHDPSSFTDGDKIIESLEGRSKEELLDMIKKLLSRHHGLLSEVGISKSNGKNVDVATISKKIKRIVGTGYYDGSRLTERLRPVREEADALADSGRNEDAALVYLKLIESCLDVFEEGIDDEGDDFFGFIVECSEAFTENAAGLTGEEFKEELIDAVLSLVGRDDWFMGLNEMLTAIATEKNIATVEKRMIKGAGDDEGGSATDMDKGTAIDALGDLYERMGKPEERIRLAKQSLVEKEDYARLAQAMSEAGDKEGAFDAVRRGLSLGEGRSPWLDELYFELASAIVKTKPEHVDGQTSLIPALGIMSGWFDPHKYGSIASVFRKIGRLDELHDAMVRCIKNRDTVAQALIYDGDVERAIKLANAVPDMHADVVFLVAGAAKDQGMPEESAALLRAFVTRSRPIWSQALPLGELIGLMVSRSDVSSLKAVCDQVVKNRLYGWAVGMMPELVKKSPELSAKVLGAFYDRMPAAVVADAARAIAVKSPEQMISLCMSKVNRDCLSSHVHYDDAVLLLKAVKDIHEMSGNESRWPGFIQELISRNTGKKKLIGKLREASLLA